MCFFFFGGRKMVSRVGGEFGYLVLGFSSFRVQLFFFGVRRDWGVSVIEYKVIQFSGLVAGVGFMILLARLQFSFCSICVNFVGDWFLFRVWFSCICFRKKFSLLLVNFLGAFCNEFFEWNGLIQCDGLFWGFFWGGGGIGRVFSSFRGQFCGFFLYVFVSVY